MRSPVLRALAPALAALCGAACGGPPPLGELALVTTRPDAVRAEVLRRNVVGEWCFRETLLSSTLRPPWRARLADHGLAIGRAIDAVPGADVLLDVELRVEIQQYLLFQRICAVAHGDAGRIE